jgi:hypothetical protein
VFEHDSGGARFEVSDANRTKSEANRIVFLTIHCFGVLVRQIEQLVRLELLLVAFGLLLATRLYERVKIIDLGILLVRLSTL